MGWEKFAISGATYARALGNAAQRAGTSLPGNVMSAISQAPQARLAPGLATRARGGIAGALQPTPQQANLQQLVSKIPTTGEGLPGMPGEGALYARHVFNKQFGNRAPQMDWSMYTPPAPRGPRDPNQATRSMLGTSDSIPTHRPTGNTPTPSATSEVGTAISNPKFRGGSPKLADLLPTIAQIGVPLATAGGVLASKPGIRAGLADFLGGNGDIQQKDTASEIPEPVLGQAHHVAEILRQRGMDPMKLRFAVDAPVGAGKSTLSRALSQEMGLHHKSLDYRPNLRINQILGGGDVEKMPMRPEPGDVLEHHQLLRAYDPESYDVAIHLLRDPETLRQRLIQRGRGAGAADLMDLDKSIDVGRRAFESLGGDSIDVGDGVVMKLRPQEGWGNKLDEELAQAGIDPAGLSRHEKLLSLNAGHAMHGSGWRPYLKNPLSTDDENKIRESVPLGAAAARALSRP